jgi:hypothetical protein
MIENQHFQSIGSIIQEPDIVILLLFINQFILLIEDGWQFQTKKGIGMTACYVQLHKSELKQCSVKLISPNAQDLSFAVKPFSRVL